MNLFQKLLKVGKSRSGATAIEYALIAGIICLALVGGLTSVGNAANDAFVSVKEGVWGS